MNSILQCKPTLYILRAAHILKHQPPVTLTIDISPLYNVSSNCDLSLPLLSLASPQCVIKRLIMCVAAAHASYCDMLRLILAKDSLSGEWERWIVGGC